MAFIENLYIKEVVHIGFLDTPDARGQTLDGPGISVSNTPESWRAIRGLNGPELTLIFSAAQWVDAMTFSDQDMFDICNWAKGKGYIKAVRAWHALVETGGDMLPVAFDTLEEAARAAGRTLEEETSSKKGDGACWQEDTYKISRRGMNRLSRWPGVFSQWEQAAILLYVKEVIIPKRPYVVGVWWSEPDKPDLGCAPSGILFPERLHRFEVEDEEGEVMPFFEKFPDFKAPEDPLVKVD
jgi:hypothetical protein